MVDKTLKMHEHQGTARYRHSTPRNLPRYRSHLQSTPPISQHIQNNPDDGSFWRLMVSISHQLCTLFWSFTCVIKPFSKCSIQIINLSVPTSTFSISVSPFSFQSPLMLISYICPSKMCLATSSMGKPNQPVETAPRKQTPDRCTVSYWLPASMKLYEWIPPPPCRGRAVLGILWIVCYIIAVPESMSYCTHFKRRETQALGDR